MNRRHLMALAAAGMTFPAAGRAASPKEITWEDLVPAGVPYGQIIGEGIMDEANDFWRPVYDANATKLNPALDGAYIRMPGYILPLELSSDGVIEFLLVPYVGACIHTPPPPANQLVLVRPIDPWPSDKLWEAVWVEGRMRAQVLSTDLADAGYTLTADHMETYVW